MDQRSLYELQFASHESDSSGANQWQRRDDFVIRQLAANLRDGGRDAAILELSVGDGALSVALLSRLETVNLTCADIARSRLEHVRAASNGSGLPVGTRLTLRECNLDMDFGSFPDAAYDAVIALDVLEHVFDVFGFVAHCRRVLARGGLLLLRVPNAAYVKRRCALARGDLPVTASWFGKPGELTAWRERHGWDGGHLHLFTIPLLRRLLEEAGLRPVQWGDPGARWSVARDLWPSLLYGNIFVAARR